MPSVRYAAEAGTQIRMSRNQGRVKKGEAAVKPLAILSFIVPRVKRKASLARLSEPPGVREWGADRVALALSHL